MNQGRIWCVVSPNVGLPLLLGSVTVIAFIVHASVMTHTTWMSNYWQGAAKPKVADAGISQPATSGSSAAYAVTVLPGATANAQPSFVITITPNAEPANAVTAANAEPAKVDVADKSADQSPPAAAAAPAENVN